MSLSPFLIWNIWKDDLNFKCLAACVSCRDRVDKESRLIGPWSWQLEQLRWQVRVFKGGLYSVTPYCRHWQLPLWPLARFQQPQLHFIPYWSWFLGPSCREDFSNLYSSHILDTFHSNNVWPFFAISGAFVAIRASSTSKLLELLLNICTCQTAGQLTDNKSEPTNAMTSLSAQTATCLEISVQQGRINQWRGRRSKASWNNHSNESPSEVCTLYWIHSFPLLLPHLPRQ